MMTDSINSPKAFPPRPAETAGDLPENVMQAYYNLTGQNPHDTRQPTPSNVTRAANYVRLSKEDESVHSLDTQPDLSHKFIAEHNWQLVATYADPDHTGRNSKRPDLQRMIRDIKAGQIDIVVVHRLDRLYRNLEALLKFIRLLKRHHVKLISVSENIDLDNDWGYLVVYVLGGLAEYYVRNLSRRTSEGKLTRVKKGLVNGSFRFGYCMGRCAQCSDPNGPGYCPRAGQADLGDGKVLVPHPIESVAVRLAYEWYAQGDLSDLDIAQRFNNYDYTLPDGSTVHFRTKGTPGHSQPGKFTRDSVRDLLTNVVYAGVAAHYPSRPLSWDDEDTPSTRVTDLSKLNRNRRVPDYLQKGLHPPLVAWSLFERCRQIRQSRGNNPCRHNQVARIYPLSGIAKCWSCSQREERGIGLRGISMNKGKRYYRCATIIDYHYHTRRRARQVEEDDLPSAVTRATRVQSESSIGCATYSVRAETIEGQVDAIVQRLKIPDEWRERIAAYYLSDEGMLEYERQRHNLTQSIQHSAFLLRSGFISQKEFEEDNTRFVQRMSRLSPRANAAAAPALAMLDDFTALWGRLTAEQRKRLLETMLAAAYFDGPRLVKIVANAPFDKLLALPEDGMIVT
jgi:DNA invertase Pin-like site-specific DNA recombinase